MSELWGVGFLALIAGSAVVGFGRKVLERRRARRTLREQAPLSSESPEGITVRATGIARVANATLTAPLSNRTCLVARSRVFLGKGMTAMAARPKETLSMVPFLLDRGEDGVVRIEGAHVLLDLPPLQMKGDDVDVRRRHLFLSMHGAPIRDMTDARFEETLVLPGDRISVAGLVMKDLADEVAADGERGFRAELPTTLRLAGNADHPLAIGRPLDRG